jgi:cell filamentation protein
VSEEDPDADANGVLVNKLGITSASSLSQETLLADLTRNAFVARLAHYYGEINAVHPFREGNGRTQRAFFGQLARDAGWRIGWSELDRVENDTASSAAL